MIQRPNLPVAALTATLLLCFLATPVAAQQVKIAVVNVSKIFDEYDARKEMETELKTEIEKINQQLATFKVQANDLVAEARILTPGSPERDAVEQKIYEAKANIELFEQLSALELEERTTDMTRELYGEIESAIGAYAVNNGYTMVLKYDSGNVTASNPTDLKLQINARQVVYFKPNLDITSQVLQLLNTPK